jgi:hypothetical protein
MNHRYIDLICLTVLTGVGAMVSSCNVPENDPGDEPERVGIAQQALGGEASCATATGIPANDGATIAMTAFVGGTVNSPDDTYNYEGSGCPKQYIVEITGWNLPANGTDVSVNWNQPLPTNATDCGNARGLTYYYEFTGGSWNTTPTGHISSSGSWNGSSCSWSSSTVGSVPSVGATKVRVAVQGWQWVGSKADHKYVTVTASPKI